MEIIIIALLFFFAMSIITFGLAWLITKKERQASEQPQNKDLFARACKAAKGFKIATIISASIPLLLLIPFLFDEPTHSSGDDLLKFFIVLSMIMLILPITSVFSYNHLFFTSSETKAFYILLTPFIPIFIIGSFIILVGGGFIGILLMLPYVIILAVMAKILSKKRKRFYAKQGNS
jgi:hypothetical protein